MSANGIGALERGYRRTPQRDTLLLLAGALALDGEHRRDFEAAAKRAGLARRGGASGTTVPWIESGGSALPFALTSFVGRETELAEIGALVRDHRMVTLTGAGGVGKTQTALHLASALSNADGAICFVGLAPIANPSLVVAAIASMLGVQEMPNRPLLETLRAYLGNKPLLLILDNCEHVITEAARAAAALLAGCPNLRILATSREPLRAAGERAYRLPSLSIPAPEASHRLGEADAAAYGAIVLFTDRAQAADHRFALTDENAPVVADLCRRLDGIPLAIELAAARVNLLSLKALAEKLDDRFGILTGGERTAVARQQTMHATIDWSYDLLGPLEQRVFERLSVFAGGCTLAAAATVCGGQETADVEVFNLLSSLADKSLVVVDLEGGDPRYRLLESFRQYAREKLAIRGEQDVVARRHALAYLELARQDFMFFYEPEYVFPETQVQQELDNWRTSLRWALTDRSDVLLGQRLAGQLLGVWARSREVEGRRWITSALELVDEGRTPTSVLADLSLAQATIARNLRECEAQLASSTTAIAHYRVVGDSLRITVAQSLAGHALTYLRRVAEAKIILEEALQRAHELNNPRWVAYILRCLGLASATGGDVVAARGYVAEALRINEATGNKTEIAWTLNDLGEHEFLAGNADLALRHETDALAIFRTLNRARGVAHALDGVAMCLVSLDRYGESEECAREALDVGRERQLDVQTAWALQHLAAIAALRPQVGAERTGKARAQAAQILGFVDARFAALGSPREPFREPEYARVLAVLREALSADTLAKLMASGAAMTEEQAIEESFNQSYWSPIN
jgi:predicted ATPase